MQQTKGILTALGAYVVWGLVPLFWPLLSDAGAIEILSHRIVWSFFFAILLAWWLKGWAWWRLVPKQTWLLLGIASLVISVNWGVYIWAVNAGHVVEAALGYYINPIMVILVGVFAFGERLSKTTWVAVGLAAVAVFVLTWDYGHPPWIALTLATSFTIYGVIKKRIVVSSVVGLAVESLVTMPLALGYLTYLGFTGAGMFGTRGLGLDLIFMAAGLITVVPLILFASAAKQVPLSTLGLIQYLSPTCQFILGVLYFGETMSQARWIGFGLVWVALFLISVKALRTLLTR